MNFSSLAREARRVIQWNPENPDLQLSPPMKIYLLRHGETEHNAKNVYQGTLDSPLSKKGQQQAKAAAQFLKNKNIQIIFASPLGRAQKTAAIIAQEIGTQIITVPEFREMNFGLLQGMDKDLARKEFAHFFQDRKLNKLHHPYPEGESYFDVHHRVAKKTQELLNSPHNIAIVGHEATNRMIRGCIMGKDPAEACHMRQKNDEVVECDP